MDYIKERNFNWIEKFHNNQYLTHLYYINNEMWWNIGDDEGYEYQKEYNKDFLNHVIPHCDNFNLAIQAGGNCGFIPRLLDKHFEFVYTFEPDNLNFICLCLNNPGPNIYKFQQCLGEKPGVVGMIKRPFKSSAGYINNKDGVVPITTIDSFNFKTCDLIQLDIEGYEYYALKGAEKTILKHRPVLHLEMHGPAYSRQDVTREMLDELLSSWNYVLVDRINEDEIYKVKNKK